MWRTKITTLGATFASLSAIGQCYSCDLNKPNIIFILTDDQGYGDIASWGHPYLKTPNMDRLVREGTSFTNYYVNSNVSSPSRVALMTGLFPARQNAHYIYSERQVNIDYGIPDFLDPNLITLPKLLKTAGYKTGHIGKWHLAGRVSNYPKPYRYGFDMDMITHGAGQHPIYKERWATTPNTVSASSHWIVDDAITFIDEQQASKTPFYLNLWMLAPHSPLLPTEEELAVYKDLKVNPADFPSWMKDYAISAKDLENQMKVYCATVTGLDNAIGKLLKYLDDKKLTQNTIIIFSSDNGPEDYNVGNSANAGVGSPGVFRGRKRSDYEGGVRVPCIVRWPGHVPKNVKNNAIWSGVDLMPTLAKITNIPIPENASIDGEDVSSLFFGRNEGRKKPLFWEWKFDVYGNQDYLAPQLALLDQNWKFYCDKNGGQVALYNLINDPEERINIAFSNTDKVEKYKALVLEWKKTIPDSYIRN